VSRRAAAWLVAQLVAIGVGIWLGTLIVEAVAG
jgi:hypothetical protein